jgi:thioester reductase-like protein
MIAQVARHFAQLLTAALADTRAPIATLAYFSAADKDAIRQRWNVDRTPYRRECVHHLIEEQVERTPDAIAVEYAGERLTYGNLNRRANQLARRLRSKGVSNGDMVGLCMDRSADLIVAVVAILKAACVVVPLDAAHPIERLRMAALRFARAATNRTRFAMFEGSYHGWSDHTLALPGGQASSIPMARGVGTGATNDVVVLEYGAPQSLETIRALGPELAAVLVEPVQSRRPDLQPKEFLRELRDITRATGTALIFDEIVTGFRVHPGGAQAWSGVDADIATYGKILGGGLPIGAVAGRTEFMDTIDGGQWSYGNGSTPTVPMTFFGGTFNKNPLSMGAAHAVLTRLAAEGPQLQQGIADEVAWLAADFNTFCRRENFPMRIIHFSSVFRFIGEGDYSLQRFPLEIDLFFHLLALRGIYVLETRVCFLATSHTREDVQFIAETAKACLRSLRDGGFFGPPPGAAPARVQARDRFSVDATLDRDFAVRPAADAAALRWAADSVLLTGATGYLGAHLTRELVRRTSAQVHCLVRAQDPEHAHERVIANLAAHGCLDPAAHTRVVAIPADLASPRLGLPEERWRQLADEVNAIYHNGAQVNSLLPYEKLRAANVEGTRELLRLAVDGRTKEVHYISSDAVFDAYGYLRQATIYEDEPLAHSDTLYGGGYAETKWVSDTLVANARAAGLPASVYRPGALTGALTGGCGQLGDFLPRFIKGVIQLGSCPELDATIDFAPVDVVSRTIVELAGSNAPGGPTTLPTPTRSPTSNSSPPSAMRATRWRWFPCTAGRRRWASCGTSTATRCFRCCRCSRSRQPRCSGGRALMSPTRSTACGTWARGGRRSAG